MLLKIREVTAGKFSYFIIAIISVPFALWGVNYYFQGGFDPVVIEVDSAEVTLSEFNESFNQRKRALEATLDPSQMPSDDAVKREVVGTLVRGRLLAREADEQRYHVPDAVVARTIVNLPEFMNDGRFDRERYLDILNANQRSQSAFEESIREQLRRNQLRSVITDSSFILPHERQKHEKFLFQERHVRYLEFPMENFIQAGSVASTEARAYYEENQQRFVTSDVIDLQYLELKVDDMAAAVDVDEEELRNYYEDNPDLFGVPEQRTLAHILIDPDRHDAPEDRADEIYAKLTQGGDFAELAETYSDDSLTAETGGELPPVTREDVDDEVAEAAFALAPGEFSEPVESAFGLQIFKLISTESSQKKSFEEAQGDIDEQFRRERAETLYQENVAQLEIISYEFSRNLERAAKVLTGVGEVKSSGPLDVSKREGLLQYPRIGKAVYTDRVLKDGENSEVLEVAPGHAFVVRVDEGSYQPGRQRSYEEVKSEITGILIKDNAWVEASAAMEAAMKRLQADEATLDELSAEQSLPLHDPGFIRRGGAPETPAIAYAAFLMPDTDGSRVRTRMHSVESYAIIELVGTREGEAASDEGLEKPELSFALDEFNAVLLGVMGDRTVEIHNDRFGEDTQ